MSFLTWHRLTLRVYNFKGTYYWICLGSLQQTERSITVPNIKMACQCFVATVIDFFPQAYGSLVIGYVLERLARRCRAMTCSLVIGTKAGNVFREILGYGLIYRNFSVLLFS